jgi:hypothetical protein
MRVGAGRARSHRYGNINTPSNGLYAVISTLKEIRRKSGSGLDVCRTDFPVVRRGKMLGKIIGAIFDAFFPVHDELAEFDPVANPIETHVDGFRASLPDGIVDDALGTCIVRLDSCCRLGMSHLIKSSAEYAGILAIVEQGADLGFCCRGQDVAHDAADDVDGSIEWRRGVGVRCGRWPAAQEKQAASAGTGFLFREIGGIAVYMEDHVTGVVL